MSVYVWLRNIMHVGNVMWCDIMYCMCLYVLCFYIIYIYIIIYIHIYTVTGVFCILIFHGCSRTQPGWFHGICLRGCLLGRWVLCTLPGEAHHDATQALHLAVNEGEIELKNMLIKEDQIGIFPILRTIGFLASHLSTLKPASGGRDALKESRSWTKLVESKSVWRCEAVLYCCLLIVYFKSTSWFKVGSLLLPFLFASVE